MKDIQVGRDEASQTNTRLLLVQRLCGAKLVFGKELRTQPQWGPGVSGVDKALT